MAAGFLNVIPPLGISGFPITGPDGGFDSPVPGLRISGGAAAGQLGGFGTPIATLVVRTAGRRPAGFRTPIPFLNLGGTVEVTVTPGGGITDAVYISPSGKRRKLILKDDSIILEVIKAYMQKYH